MTAPDVLEHRLTPLLARRPRYRHGGAWPTHKARARSARHRAARKRHRQPDPATTEDTRRTSWI